MDYPNNNTSHSKGKHLNYDELHLIEIRLRDGWTANRIAVEELHCSPNTVRNAIKKGMTSLYQGRIPFVKDNLTLRGCEKTSATENTKRTAPLNIGCVREAILMMMCY